VLTDVEVRYSLRFDRTGYSGGKAVSRDCWKLSRFSYSSLTSFSLSNSYPNPNRMKYSSRLLLVVYATQICLYNQGRSLLRFQTLQVMKVRRSSPSDCYIPALIGVSRGTGSGKVVKVGSAVTRVKEGDSVLLSFNYCSNCGPCKVSRNQLRVDEKLTFDVDDR